MLRKILRMSGCRQSHELWGHAGADVPVEWQPTVLGVRHRCGQREPEEKEEEEGSASEESPEVSQKRGKWGWCLLGSADLIIMCVQLQGFPIHLTVTLQSSARIAGASLAPIPQHCVVHRVAKGFCAGCGGGFHLCAPARRSPPHGFLKVEWWNTPGFTCPFPWCFLIAK